MSDNTSVDTAYIHETTKQANIKMLDRSISVFVNKYGRATPILVVARAKVDNTEYAALFDMSTKKAYAVEVVREKGEVKEFRDLDGPNQDEEWGVISNYFLKEKVYDTNRISMWIWNTKVHNGGIAPETRVKRSSIVTP